MIQLEARDRLLQLVVRDDGQGFSVDEARAQAARSGGLGLLGMSERTQLAGGWFKLRSAKGLGTRISVTLPIGGAGNGVRAAESGVP